MSTIIVERKQEKIFLPFSAGENLLVLLRRHGILLSAPCGGHGRCGKCRVEVVTGGIRQSIPACTYFPEEDCRVILPDDGGDVSWNAVAADQTPVFQRSGFGAAVDLGTTTVAVQLYRLTDGMCLGSAGAWNAQKGYGADVISRIDYCQSHGEGLSQLQEVIRSQIRELLRELCRKQNVPMGELREIFLAGNTVMQHIFAGLSPVSIAAAPFTPLCDFTQDFPADLESIPVYFAPCVAGYVGGDITAGLLAAGLHEKEGNFLFIDVGTNGEMALGGAQGFVTCAVASGPAFEGAEIACGMPAENGAVFRVDITAQGLTYEVLGGGEPRGLCGSGLLDLTACLLELGYLDESGVLAENEQGEAVFYLTETVYLTQRDIRQLQLAKAAVAAGVRLLLRRAGLTCAELDGIYLAGGFGSRLRLESAVRIGMLPGGCRVVSCGNTSLLGAQKALLHPEERQTLRELQARCRYRELSGDAEFNDCFIEELSFQEVTV